MKTYSLKNLTILSIALLLSFQAFSQKDKKKDRVDKIDTLNYTFGSGNSFLEISFIKGEEFNHPTFAIWIEDINGKYIETIFVTKSFATATFGNADAGDGTWKSSEGESIRPAALPYWTHKRNVVSRDTLVVPTPENPLTDAISGATPSGSFLLKTNISPKPKETFKILFEINQTWDWNYFWTNNKYPGDKDYQSSSQPSVIYEGTLDPNSEHNEVQLKAIGHGHYSGDDGSLTEDLSTLTTALEITNQINVSITTKK